MLWGKQSQARKGAPASFRNHHAREGPEGLISAGEEIVCDPGDLGQPGAESAVEEGVRDLERRKLISGSKRKGRGQ